MNILLYVLAAVYPVLVFCFLVVFKIPLRYFSVFIVLVALVLFLGATSQKKGRLRLLGAGLLGAVGLACLASGAAVFLKLYPVLMNLVMLGAFAYTLFSPPCIIFRFARLQDKTIAGAPWEKKVEAYCRNVTLVWCGFFVVNGSIAAITVFSGSDMFWSVYNGGISYMLMGVLFAVELLVRKITDKKIRAMPVVAVLDSRLLRGVILREQSAGRLVVDFSVSPESDYFNEHFPQLKILPAVAQFELALRFANRYWGVPLRVSGSRRLKFSSMVRPDVPLRLELAKEGNVLSFVIAAPQGKPVYSSGSCVLDACP